MRKSVGGIEDMHVVRRKRSSTIGVSIYRRERKRKNAVDAKRECV